MYITKRALFLFWEIISIVYLEDSYIYQGFIMVCILVQLFPVLCWLFFTLGWLQLFPTLACFIVSPVYDALISS